MFLTNNIKRRLTNFQSSFAPNHNLGPSCRCLPSIRMWTGSLDKHMFNTTWVGFFLHFPQAPKLTAKRYIPGHIHAFYIEYVYYERREAGREGRFQAARAPGIYSDRVQGGGYGTIVEPTN